MPEKLLSICYVGQVVCVLLLPWASDYRRVVKIGEANMRTTFVRNFSG